MTITVTLSFQVPDYDAWKAAFFLDKTEEGNRSPCNAVQELG
jgi:hypothetical protein